VLNPQIVTKLQDTLDRFDVGNDFGGGGAVSNHGYDTKQQYDSSVPGTDL